MIEALPINVSYKQFRIKIQDSAKHPGTYKYTVLTKADFAVAFGFKQKSVEAASEHAKNRINSGRVGI